MAMRYFKSPDGVVNGYDDADDAWADLMQSQAIDAGWQEVTDSWPPAEPVSPPSPDVEAFMASMKNALGGAVALNTLLRAYPLLITALQLPDYDDAQALLIDAKATAAITATQAVAINSAATTANIPITIQ